MHESIAPPAATAPLLEVTRLTRVFSSRASLLGRPRTLTAKKAPEVERDFKKQHDGKLPVETIVSKYATRIGPSDSVGRGQDLNFYSDIELVKGRNQQAKKDIL